MVIRCEYPYGSHMVFRWLYGINKSFIRIKHYYFFSTSYPPNISVISCAHMLKFTWLLDGNTHMVPIWFSDGYDITKSFIRNKHYGFLLAHPKQYVLRMLKFMLLSAHIYGCSKLYGYKVGIPIWFPYGFYMVMVSLKVISGLTIMAAESVGFQVTRDFGSNSDRLRLLLRLDAVPGEISPPPAHPRDPPPR